MHGALLYTAPCSMSQKEDTETPIVLTNSMQINKIQWKMCSVTSM